MVSDANENTLEYYGDIQNIIEYTFGGPKVVKVVFFDCLWFDPRNGTRVDEFGMVEMLRHAKKAFSKARSRSKGSDGGSSSVGSIFQGTVQSRQWQQQLLGCMEECAEQQAEEEQAEGQQVEEQQAEGQMELDAEEEARADAELAASHAANPMMDGVETGGSSSSGTIRPSLSDHDVTLRIGVGERWVGQG
ncbi:hypothetical protein U9M48_027874 [Paspalum notatum var. saurae]|uniref:DUF4216 domain-containing protein n=1 Tax=Paspalum notatum var. saurae TaxID=547442 RepID=A0AAQ3TVH1_PASNO